MTLPTPLARSESDWQTQLRDVITSPVELFDSLELQSAQVSYSNAANGEFALKVPRSFIDRMQRGNPDDPLLRQVLASSLEMIETPGYTRDPVGETGGHIVRPGIIHKYHGRALLIVSAGCAVNCRYCFRRHFPYEENRNSREQWQDALTYIGEDPDIEEVILSGGDPLVTTDEHLRRLVEQLAAIPHVRRLRVHSRLPVVIPDRITAPLLDAITHPDLQSVMVIHCNHPQEINGPVKSALANLRAAGVTTLNQAVLLAEINDTAEVQAALSRELFAAGALPYYLHLMDKVQGAAHFDVPEDRARMIMAQVSAVLPGYLVPKLVREISGATAKINVPPAC